MSVVDPERFRVSKGRGARWYRDDLPPCELVPDAVEPFECPAWTTIAGAWPKFLAPWVAECVAKMAVERPDEWRHLDATAAVEVLKAEPDRQRQTAATRGTTIHRLLEQIAVGQEPDLAFVADAEPYLPAMRAFVAECRPRWVLSEAVGFNRTIGYGGTTDADLFLDGVPDLGVRVTDFKTRKDLRAFPENGVQVSAYSAFEYVMVPGPTGEPVRQRPPSTDGGLVVVITPEDYALFPVTPSVDGVERLHAFWSFFRTAASLIGAAVPHPTDQPMAQMTRQWLIDRVAVIVADEKARDFLAACWPRGVPTFKHSDDHTDGQLAAIEAVLNLVEKECSITFPASRPGTPKLGEAIVPPKDAAPIGVCQSMIDRLKALPSDLLAVVEAEASKNNVPNLRSGRVTVDELASLDQIVAMVEGEVVTRRQQTVDALGSYAADELAGVIRALACHGLDRAVLTQAEIARVRAVVDAVNVLLLSSWYGNEDGPPSLMPAPNAEAELIAAHGSKSALLAAARTICEGLGMVAPRSASACCADPLLVALLHEARLSDQQPAATTAA